MLPKNDFWVSLRNIDSKRGSKAQVRPKKLTPMIRLLRSRRTFFGIIDPEWTSLWKLPRCPLSLTNSLMEFIQIG